MDFDSHPGCEIQVVEFSPVDSDEIIIEFRSRDDRGVIVEILEVFRREGSEELLVRLVDQPVSAKLVQWAIEEAAKRLV
ncbi:MULTISPECIES: hypothetical protein [unclassified Streptomyces]|uniref:hypothetical protein n=1 Tax=unclassified Streptomyces TaxID=2593676 RepID=UPI0022B6AD2A|nr:MULTISPECIES: hypothetical protein [unclassified Streptomyces]MCZ7414108.1 hypothetical protein [Streptomyces sp. WMMC897]MCZ7431103.1 hypothetical protein [Streptomyces sp. WMMC1477]